MADRRLQLALGAVALFGVGFGLGWLVRGEHEAPADLDPHSAANAAAIAEAGLSGGGDGGVASGPEGGVEAGGSGATPGAVEGASGEGGDTAVIGGEAEGSGGSAGAAAEGEGDGSNAAGSASLDGGVTGRLDADAIRDVVREHREQLGFCFAWQLHRHPDLQGRVVMEFEIGSDGHVTEARVADDELGDDTVLRCFLGVTRRMQFPAPEGGSGVTVRYPFQLAPDGPDDGDE